MLELAEDENRSQASLELRFMQAVRVAVPACFDGKLQNNYDKREQKLLDEINDTKS